MPQSRWLTLFLVALVGAGGALLVAVAHKDDGSPGPGLIAQDVAVVQPDGTPIEGAVVIAEQDGAVVGAEVPTDPDGVAHLTLPAGTYRFQVQWRDRQFVSEASYTCPVPCEQPLLVLPFAQDVLVQEPDGTPVSGAIVAAFSGLDAIGGSFWTDTAGVAHLALPAGLYRFRVLWHGHESWSAGTDHCPVPCGPSKVTVGYLVDVHVTTTAGEPVANALVTLFAVGALVDPGYRTDASGTARLALQPGHYTFQVEWGGMVFDVQDALDVPAQRHLELRVPPCDDCEVSEFPETGSTGSGTGSDTATCDGDQPPTQAPPGDCWICEDNFWKTIDKDFAEATKKAVSYCNESSEVPASSGGPGGGGGPTEKMRLFDENKRAAQNYIAMCRNLLMDAASMNLGIELLDNDFKKAQNSILRAQLLPPAEFDKKCGANVEGGACAVLPGGDIFVRDNNNQAMTISIQDSLLHEGVHVLLNSAAPLDTAEAAAARDHPFWTGFRQKHPIEQACRG